MINSNPETVSTDYDTANKLYFEPLTLEDVLEIYQQEGCSGAIVQFGGQTPLKLARALARPQAFGNRSQLKTWLVGILKHKIIDTLRQQAREVSVGADDGDGDAELDALVFQADGHFAARPSDWGNPEQDLRSRQFFEVLEACADKLPPAMARVFLMREWLELPTEDICKELGLTSTNLYVQLHRARLRLRECLELNWFATPRAV